MNSLYIGRYGKKRTHPKWPYVLVLFLALLLVVARFAAPVVAENWINERGSDGKGYHYRVGDVSMNHLEGEIRLTDLRVYNPENMINLVEAPVVTLRFKWQDVIRGDHSFKVEADQLNFILSKALSDEIQRIEDLADHNEGHQIHLDKIDGQFKRISVIEADDTNLRTILTLTDSKVSGKELAIGGVNPKSEFSLVGKIAEGGSIDLKGKAIEKNDSIPWIIQGKMTDIQKGVLEKLTGDKLPIVISKPKLNAEIIAHSLEGQITGTLTPDITQFNLREEEKTAWGDVIVKVRSYDLERAIASEGAVKFGIPFTVKDNLSLDIGETVNEVKGQVKGRVLAL